MKTYAVKETFYSLQGEGFHSGRPAVFCRFAGCNLWSGREEDRATAACPFCDTDFVGGERFHALALAGRLAEVWGSPYRPRYVVLTGGEPTLQVDDWLVEVLHRWEFEVAIETNGTRAVPRGVDWVTVSPKAGAPLVQRTGQELKLVYPQEEVGAEPERFASLPFERFSLQPRDGLNVEANTRAAVAYCLAHPRWRLSLQTHKILGLR